MKLLHIIDDPVSGDFESIWTDDVIATLISRYGSKAPKNAKLYVDSVSVNSEVTPQTEAEVAAIASMQGPFFFVVYPQDPYSLVFLILVAVAVVALAPKPPSIVLRNVQNESPNNGLKKRTNEVRINGRIPDIFGTVTSYPDLLSDYTVFENHIEVNHSYLCVGRGYYDFPDVDGAPRIRDGDTLASKIEGMKVAVYEPFTSPNTSGGVTPQIQIGDAIDQLVIAAKRSKAVNGQVLRAPNDAGDERIVGSSNIRFEPDVDGTGFVIQANPASSIDFTIIFSASDPITLTAPVVDIPSLVSGSGDLSNIWPNLPPFDDVVFYDDGTIEFAGTPALDSGTQISDLFYLGVAPITKESITVNLTGWYRHISHDYLTQRIQLEIPYWLQSQWAAISGMSGDNTGAIENVTMVQGGSYNVSGSYTVDSVSAKTIKLDNAQSVNAEWLKVVFNSPYLSPTVEASGSDTNWIGPFVLDTADMNEIIANFVAPQGLWKDNGSTQTAFDVEVQLGVTPCDSAGTSTGAESYYNGTVLGSANVRSQRALTMRQTLLATGRVKVRARRLTNKDTAFAGTVSDEVKWRDVYSVTPIAEEDFGNVTTIQAVVQATQGALAVAERQLNCLVTRKVYAHVANDIFSNFLTPSRNAADILSFVCLDPKIGNRNKNEIDFANLYSTAAAIESYFGFSEAAEFSYTFDKPELSFEETVQIIAGAVFSQAYRRGNSMQLFFEKATPDSVLLFNHRNKIPKSELRTRQFGNVGNYDGVEFEYVSDVDDAVITFYVPEDRSATNPKRITSVGIRNAQQAELHAYREYNKLRYQREFVQFDALQEADIMVRGERMLVANNTRADTKDGEIEEQVGLVLRLSQPVDFAVGVNYVIFLQHVDGSVESIEITPGGDAYHVVLGTTPTGVLSLDEAASVRTLYTIVPDTETGKNAFLLTEKSYNDGFTLQISGVNYDARYYEHDQEFAP